jgi:hypothetical protein
MQVHFENDMDNTERNWEIMTTTTAEETLAKQYGPLLSINQLATLLDRSPDGLRITLRSSGEWVSKINATRLRLGRRVYFRTAEVANVLGIR